MKFSHFYVFLNWLCLSTLVVFFTSCEKEPKFILGQKYQGGVIFYIDKSNEHGLIVAEQDLGTATWGCQSLIVGGADKEEVGFGLENTTAVVNACDEEGIAAKLCFDLVLDGYDDWFLPSKDELNLLYLQRDLVGGFVSDGNAPYWSSTEYEESFGAWRQLFSPVTEQTIYDKYLEYNVRPIRRF